MNQEFFERAMKVIDELTVEEMYEFFKAHNIDFVIRQFPEPQDEENDDD